MSLLGPSGCGKTTLLRIIAGFETPTDGELRVDGHDITHMPPNRRKIGMVFQNYALFPHMTIADNVASGKLDAKIAVVITNRTDAPGIESARRRGLKALVIPSKGVPREEHDRLVVAALEDHKVDLVCLAGYMRLLSPWFVQQFPNRILNIHPSLLPAFPGLDAQKQAFDYGVKVSGCTVHFVDADLDHGAIILQKTLPVLDSDDDHTLAGRILEHEHVAYSEAIALVLGGKYDIVGRRIVFND